jgi:hypothetical protein
MANKKNQKHEKRPEQQPTPQPTAPATPLELSDVELGQVVGGAHGDRTPPISPQGWSN